MVKTHFLLTDRFGQDVELTKTHSDKVLERLTELELLIMDFEHFLVSTGFPKDEIETTKEKVRKQLDRGKLEEIIRLKRGDKITPSSTVFLDDN